MPKKTSLYVLLEFLSDAVYAWKGEVSHYFKAEVNQKHWRPLAEINSLSEYYGNYENKYIIWIL